MSIGFTSCIVKVLWVPLILHFEPSLESFSLRSDVISLIKILSLSRMRAVVLLAAVLVGALAQDDIQVSISCGNT